MRHRLVQAMGVGLILFTATDLHAGNGFELVTYSVVGSAGVQEIDTWRMFSAVGQPIAGEDVTGNGFSITSGFPPISGGEIQCQADLTNDGELNFFDISVFLGAFGEQSEIADFNNDGFYDFFDIASFISLYSLGCP